MRLSIIAIGRLKAGPDRDLYQRYADRLTGVGRALSLGPLQLVELAEARAAQATARRNEEADHILTKLPDTADLIVLDENGKQYSSERFAQMIGARRDAGTQELCFAIGGPDGHGAAVRDAARATLGLGRMTLPHGLARIVLVEQLYRAATILAGHPYHRS